jgi:hypothetical protein
MSPYLSQLNVTLSLPLKLIALAKLLGVIIIAMSVYGAVWWVMHYMVAYSFNWATKKRLHLSS